MPTLDELIAHHLADALSAGELQASPGWGKPLPEMPGWDETPDALRMPFKILKDAGFAPPEIALFHERARLREAVAACVDEGERQRLQQKLSELEQALALRLEALRVNSTL